MTDWKNGSYEGFADALASTAPVPGGGGAAALCGALAAALCAMAARLTAGRKKYADSAGQLDEITRRADELRRRLLALIVEDAEGFAPLAAAYSLPKDDPKSAAILRGAVLKACEAPAEMLLSDVGCGAALARAAIAGAAMNVFVNTKMLPGDPESEYRKEEALRLRAEYLPRAETIAEFVTARLTE